MTKGMDWRDSSAEEVSCVNMLMGSLGLGFNW